MSAGRRPAAAERSESSARALAEQVARTSYGRLLALLSASTGDIELAEDCLGEAFAKALRTWPRTGTPDNPEAWLLTTARNRQRDVHRSAAVRTSTPLDDAVAVPFQLQDAAAARQIVQIGAQRVAHDGRGVVHGPISLARFARMITMPPATAQNEGCSPTKIKTQIGLRSGSIKPIILASSERTPAATPLVKSMYAMPI